MEKTIYLQKFLMFYDPRSQEIPEITPLQGRLIILHVQGDMYFVVFFSIFTDIPQGVPTVTVRADTR